MSIKTQNDDIQRAHNNLDKIVSCKELEPEKLKMLLPDLDLWVARVNKLLELDLALQEGMKTSIIENTRHQIISDGDFKDKITEIGDDSLIIYVKKAQLYKVYNPDENGDTSSILQSFVNDDNTKYRPGPYRNNGNVYEVVRDTHPQRLLIRISEDIDNNKIATIKKHVIEFTKKYTEFSNTTIEHLKVYGNDNGTEILVSNIHFNNINERDEFIESFIKYMREDKHDTIADKIEVRPPLGNIRGTRMYKIGSQKIAKDSMVIIDSLDHLVTQISPSGEAHLTFTGPVTIVNGGNNNLHIGDNITKIKTKNIRTIKSFCNYIYETKPSWFKEGKYIDMDIIENAYKEYFNEPKANSSSISKKLNGILFTDSERTGKHGKTKTLKKLVTRAELKTAL